MTKCKPKNNLSKLGKTKTAIKEYVERMFKLFNTLSGTSTDYHIDCPKCGHSRCLEFINPDIWRCLYVGCEFSFPKDLVPPSPRKLNAYWEYKKSMEEIRQLENQLETLGIKLP